MKRFLLAAILLLAGLCWLPRAHAATTCTANATSLNFPAVTGANAVDSTATVAISCSTSQNALLVLGTTYVNMCLSIDAGAKSGGVITPWRQMTNASNSPMQFQIYRDTNHTQVWGNASPNNVQLSLTYPIVSLVLPLAGSGSVTPNPTIYAEIPVQPGLIVGSYDNSFTIRLDYRYDEPVIIVGSMPDSCTGSSGDGGGSSTSSFTAHADVVSNCRAYTTTDLNFGSVAGNITTNLDQTSTIGLTCTIGTAWKLGLSNGQNANGNTRRMRQGITSNYVSYELYRDPGRSQRWGGTLDIDTVPGTGTGSPQTATVFGRVPAPQTPAAGSYSDTITVTITY